MEKKSSRANELEDLNEAGYVAGRQIKEAATRIIHELEAAPTPAWLGGEITEFIPDDMPDWVQKAMDEGQYFTVTLARIKEMERQLEEVSTMCHSSSSDLANQVIDIIEPQDDRGH